MTGRNRGLVAAGVAAAVVLVAVAFAARADDDFNPCAAPAPRNPRVIIAFVKSSGFLGLGGGCKTYVNPGEKTVCQGDTVHWSVINTCDADTFKDILIPDLDEVIAAPCTTVPTLGIGDVKEIRCTLKTNIAREAKYRVARGTKEKHELLVDPELDIRR